MVQIVWVLFGFTLAIVRAQVNFWQFSSYNCPNNNVQVSTASNDEQCVTSCLDLDSQTVQCVGAVYYPALSTNNCWAKGSFQDCVVASTSELLYVLAAHKDENSLYYIINSFDCPNIGDISNHVLLNTELLAAGQSDVLSTCDYYCHAISNCIGFVYDGLSTCYFKSAAVQTGNTCKSASNHTFFVKESAFSNTGLIVGQLFGSPTQVPTQDSIQGRTLVGSSSSSRNGGPTGLTLFGPTSRGLISSTCTGPVCCNGISFPEGSTCCGGDSIIAYACPSGYFCSNSSNHTCVSTAGLVIGILIIVFVCGCGAYRQSNAEAAVAVTNDAGQTAPAAASGGGATPAPTPAADLADQRLLMLTIALERATAAAASVPTQSNEAMSHVHHGSGVQMTQMQPAAQQYPATAGAGQFFAPPPQYAPPAQMPPGWIVQTDPTSGTPFFVYTPTGHTQWNRPA